MTLDELRQYRAKKLQIELIRDELNQKHTIGDSVESASKFPYKKHTVNIMGYRPSEHVNRELVLLLQLKNEVKEIEEFYAKLEDVEIKAIVKLKYLSGRQRVSWQYIALKLGYCSDHTPKRKLIRFLRENS